MGFVPEPDDDVGFKDYCCCGVFFVFLILALLLGVFM